MVFMLSQPAVENLQQVLIACINHRNCRGKAPLISVQDSWWRILQLYRSETLQYNSVSHSGRALVCWPLTISTSSCVQLAINPLEGSREGPLLTTNIAGKSPDQPGQKDKDPDVWFQLMTLCFPDFPDLIISHWFQNITWAEGSSIIEREILQSVRAWILYK